MNRKIPLLISSGLLALVAAATAGLAQAAPEPVLSQSHFFGRAYSTLAADWLEWAISIPADVNPILDPDGADAAIGQSGKVWFLAGNFGGETKRTIAVPYGRALFFPIVNYFWVNLPELGDNPWSDQQAADVRAFLESNIDTAQDLVLEIDGKVVRNVYDLRVYSTVGACSPPVTDNIFGLEGIKPYPHPCVVDGYWALLPPLSVGRHTIRVAGKVPATNFELDVTYRVKVMPRP